MENGNCPTLKHVNIVITMTTKLVKGQGHTNVY